MRLFTNLFIVFLSIFVAWFFLFKKESAAKKVQDKVRIIVQGGYTPNVIEVPVGKPITLQFDRRDPSSCLEEVVIPDFHVRQFLPLNQVTSITIIPQETGE